MIKKFEHKIDLFPALIVMSAFIALVCLPVVEGTVSSGVFLTLGIMVLVMIGLQVWSLIMILLFRDRVRKELKRRERYDYLQELYPEVISQSHSLVSMAITNLNTLLAKELIKHRTIDQFSDLIEVVPGLPHLRPVELFWQAINSQRPQILEGLIKDEPRIKELVTKENCLRNCVLLLKDGKISDIGTFTKLLQLLVINGADRAVTEGASRDSSALELYEEIRSDKLTQKESALIRKTLLESTPIEEIEKDYELLY